MERERGRSMSVLTRFRELLGRVRPPASLRSLKPTFFRVNPMKVTLCEDPWVGCKREMNFFRQTSYLLATPF